LKIPNPPLLVITDRKITGEERLIDVVEGVFRGGCRWLMVREKDLPRQELSKLVCKIVKIAGDYGAVVVVNKDYEVADACGAGGVHLPWGFPIEESREKIGPNKLLGVSAHSLEEALEAERRGADYITLSPIFKTVSKKHDNHPPLGVEKIREVVRKVSIPVIALGGITRYNVKLCLEAGASGVAVIGSIMASDNPEEATREIITRLSSF